MTSMTGDLGRKWQGDKVPSGYKNYQMANYTPEQMGLFDQSLQNVGPESYLSRLAGGDQSMFEEMERPALRQFGELQGNIASRFSAGGGGPGALSGRRSSGFQNTMGKASSDFAQQLQANRLGLRQQAIKDLHSMSQQLLGNRPYERWMEEKKPSGWESFGQAALPFVGGAIGGVFGGPAGAMAGYQVGQAGAGAWSGKGGGMDLSGVSNLPTSWGTSPSSGSSGNYNLMNQASMMRG